MILEKSRIFEGKIGNGRVLGNSCGRQTQLFQKKSDRPRNQSSSRRSARHADSLATEVSLIVQELKNRSKSSAVFTIDSIKVTAVVGG